jgi:hypothetical protein
VVGKRNTDKSIRAGQSFLSLPEVDHLPSVAVLHVHRVTCHCELKKSLIELPKTIENQRRTG